MSKCIRDLPYTGLEANGETNDKQLHKNTATKCIPSRLLHRTYPIGVLHGSVHRLTCITRSSLLVMQGIDKSRTQCTMQQFEEE